MGIFDFFHAWTRAYLEQTMPSQPNQPNTQPKAAQYSEPKKQPAAEPVKTETITPEEPKPETPKQPDVQPKQTPEQKEIYLAEQNWKEPDAVERITLTEKEAAAQGWRFQRKSRKRAAIKRYIGRQQDVVVPAQIGEYIVNELKPSAFSNLQIGTVQIPNTVKKLGKDCFRQSSVRKIVIDAPVREIPSGFAFSCLHLEEVQLPSTLFRIQTCAFENCRSLKYIMLHYRCGRVEAWAFKNSGLTGFSCRCVRDFDGTALINTPLDETYQVISAKDWCDYRYVLLIGKHARNVKLPKGSVSFCKRSILNRGKELLVLDCSQNGCPSFRSDSIEYQYYMYNGAPYRTAPLKIIFSTRAKDERRYFIDGCVDAKYADGTPYEPFLQEIRSSGDSAEYQLMTSIIPTGSYYLHERDVKIHGLERSYTSIYCKAK